MNFEYKTNLILFQNFINISWILTISILLSITYFFYLGRADGFIVSFIYPAIGRIIWSICIIFFILITCSQYGNGPITNLWNSKIFLPLSRFSFSAYILNPLIVLYYVLTSEKSYHYDMMTSTIMTIGFIFTTYFFAFLFIIFFEMPITNLVSLLLSNKKQKQC